MKKFELDANRVAIANSFYTSGPVFAELDRANAEAIEWSHDYNEYNSVEPSGKFNPIGLEYYSITNRYDPYVIAKAKKGNNNGNIDS
jgi:hypothetical protein